jgi:hypothetical protein
MFALCLIPPNQNYRLCEPFNQSHKSEYAGVVSN